MPSLRQRVTTYFRQLSFIADNREDSRYDSRLSPRHQDDGSFITKYLKGRMEIFAPGPDIKSGKEPTDLPNLILAQYETGTSNITAAYTGPDSGLTGIQRVCNHLTAGPDIDFIDTVQDQDTVEESRPNASSRQKSINLGNRQKSSDQNANKATTSVNNNNNNKLVKNQFSKNSLHNDLKLENKKKLTIPDSKFVERGTINVVVSMISSTKIDKTIDNNNLDLKKQTESIDSNNKNIKYNNLEFPKNTVGNIEEIKNEEQIIKQKASKDSLELVAGLCNWKLENDHAYGLSVSLYEKNQVTNEPSGSPIADCFGIVVRGDVAALALADGVNWGEGARLAARSAVHGSLEYLNTAVFGQVQGGMAASTREVFISLLRSFWAAHACILEVGGALSTLTVAVVLPLGDEHVNKYAVCCCNVGDSLGYVYSKKHGVREFTQGSHDINSMRDMRDALGALGPVDGNKPELGNLTLSLTIVENGDIVFLTSDGISDNFDPVVGKFAEALVERQTESQTSQQTKFLEPQLAPRRQNKSASALYTAKTEYSMKTRKEILGQSSSTAGANSKNNHLISSTSKSGSNALSTSFTDDRSSPNKNSRNKKTTFSVPKSSPISGTTETIPHTRPKYMRSHTVIEPRVNVTQSTVIKFKKSTSGLPMVNGVQRHALTLLRLEDLLCYGINGTLKPCTNAKKLCHLLVDFAKMITAAKRKILEQREIYYKVATGPGGERREVEMTNIQQRGARKRAIEGNTYSSLPGKLDHASVVAFTVGAGSGDQEDHNYTDF